MPGRSVNPERSRFTFNNKELDREWGMQDYGARIYDNRVIRFLSTDPLKNNYPSSSSYTYVRNNPILRVDADGRWDIEVHVYNTRTKYGYGIAIVKDRTGKEIYRFKVRVQGAGGSNRLQTNNDTPNGVYDIPDDDKWISGGERGAYGPNPRLILEGVSGEIEESGRSGIRIHGGRQESYNSVTGQWSEIENPQLKKTHGCLRCYDEAAAELKEVTDQLEENDPLEKGGQLTMIEDLKKDGVSDSYYLESDKKAYGDKIKKIDADFKQQQQRVFDKYKQQTVANSDKTKARKELRSSNAAIRKEHVEKTRNAAREYENKKIN